MSEYLEYSSQSKCFSEVIIAQLKEAKSINSVKSLTQAYIIANMVVIKLEETLMGQGQDPTINYLTSGKSIHDISYKINHLLEELQKAVGENFVIVNQSIQSLAMSLSNLERRKNYLVNLPDFNHSLTNFYYLQDYKIIGFNQIEKVNLVNIKAVETISKFTLFPIVNDVNEEMLSDFLIDSGHKNYEFLLDIQPELKFIESQTKIINSKIEMLLSQYVLLSEQVYDLVERWMKNKIYDIENKLNESACEVNIAKQIIEQEKSKREKLELESQEQSEQDLADLEANSRNKSIFIKQKYKGLYSYRWKSERKTWRYAKKTIYFDFGDEMLFERIDSKLFRKILKQDFINKYRL